MTAKPLADHSADLALVCYVLADGVFLNHSRPIPASWFQVDYPEGFARIMVASGPDEIRACCDAIAHGGLQPIVVTDDVDSPAFLALDHVASGTVRVRYSIRHGQRLPLLDALATPDRYAIEAWQAMDAGAQIEARNWPAASVLAAYGDAWRHWCDVSPDVPELELGSRRFDSGEFETLTLAEEEVCFSHATAPFAMLRVHRATQQVIPAGAFSRVPEGITAKALLDRLNANTTAPDQPSWLARQGSRAGRYLSKTLLHFADDWWIQPLGARSVATPKPMHVQELLDGLSLTVWHVEGGLRFELRGWGAEFAGKKYRCGLEDHAHAVVVLSQDWLNTNVANGSAFLALSKQLDKHAKFYFEEVVDD